MKIDILTLFPEMFTGPFSESIIKRAQEKRLVEINIHNIRNWTTDKHKTVDDKPYSGGAGMVLMVEPIYNALQDLTTKSEERKTATKSSKTEIKNKSTHTTHHTPYTILLSPQGKQFDQKTAKRLSELEHIILIAGHYEGFDQRIRDNLVDEEISIGNYVLTGGELPAMVITDSIVRLIPNVLGDKGSLINETHSKYFPSTAHHPPRTNIKYPVYTRPENFKGWKVPGVLLSGNHAKIKKWKKDRKTKKPLL